ncbi:hypothetical protein DFH09DRAFT_1305302 [Mycena vulgaris]|nr:hypothetical protein DFH09DRAFT_1305302 [Mycena vulgaris]
MALGLISSTAGDRLLFFNYRSDRMRELVSVLGLPDRPMEVTVPKDLGIMTMSRYNTDFPFAAAFLRQAIPNVREAEVLATHEIKQAHITGAFTLLTIRVFFLTPRPTYIPSSLAFDLCKCMTHRKREIRPRHLLLQWRPREAVRALEEKQFALEECFMIPSSKVATYYLKPEMSVQAVLNRLARCLFV